MSSNAATARALPPQQLAITYNTHYTTTYALSRAQQVRRHKAHFKMDGSKGAHATCATKPEGDSKGTIVVLGATGNQGKPPPYIIGSILQA